MGTVSWATSAASTVWPPVDGPGAAKLLRHACFGAAVPRNKEARENGQKEWAALSEMHLQASRIGLTTSPC